MTFQPRSEADLRQSLSVAIQPSACGRHLVRYEAPDAPYFYLGDTAWELFHRLDDAEAEMYLRNRAAKGFTSVMVVILAEHGCVADRAFSADYLYREWMIIRAGNS